MCSPGRWTPTTSPVPAVPSRRTSTPSRTGTSGGPGRGSGPPTPTRSPRVDEVADFELRLVLEVLGPRLGSDVQKVIRAVRAGAWQRDGASVAVLDRVLEPDEFELVQRPRDEHSAKALPGGSGIVWLDTQV